jgi:hypothetical protein
MDRVSWDWILNGLDEALGFCRGLDLGRHVEGSRFEEHRAWVAELLAELKTGGQETARAAFHRDPVRSFAALTEGSELAGILSFAKTVPAHTIKRKLLDVLQGPALPTAEGKNTNLGRNVLFELNLASKLWRAGFSPILGEHPDVLCRVDGRDIYIECKRPLSENGIGVAYRRALYQLATDLKGTTNPDARGVVALSLTRLLNPGDLVFMHPTEGAGVEGLGDWLEQTAERLCSGWREPSPATIGILWHVLTPGYVRRERLVVGAEQLNTQPTRPVDSRDHVLFQRLFTKLRGEKTPG